MPPRVQLWESGFNPGVLRGLNSGRFIVEVVTPKLNTWDTDVSITASKQKHKTPVLLEPNNSHKSTVDLS